MFNNPSADIGSINAKQRAAPDKTHDHVVIESDEDGKTLKVHRKLTRAEAEKLATERSHDSVNFIEVAKVVARSSRAIEWSK